MQMMQKEVHLEPGMMMCQRVHTQPEIIMNQGVNAKPGNIHPHIFANSMLQGSIFVSSCDY